MHEPSPCASIGMILAGAALALLLGISADPVAAAQPDEGLAAEAALAAAQPGLFRRNGNTLRIGENALTDNVTACTREDTPCVNYRADRIFGRHVGVRVESFEAGSYLIVGQKAGDHTEIGDPPVPSPSGKRFAVVAGNEMASWLPLDGAAVWEWRAGAPQRLRVVDYALMKIENVIAWHGDACVELEGWPETEATSVWLSEHDGDWQLSRKRPRMCKG